MLENGKRDGKQTGTESGNKGIAIGQKRYTLYLGRWLVNKSTIKYILTLKT